MYAPAPRRMKTGSSRPTARMARMGELTPPGMTAVARCHRGDCVGDRINPVPNTISFSQPSGCLLRPVRDHDPGPRPPPGCQTPERGPPLVEVPGGGCGLHHRVLAGDAVCRQRRIEALAH